MKSLPLAVIGLTAWASAAMAAEDTGVSHDAMVERGAALAELWCNACHVTGVGRSEDPMPQSPSFRQLSTMAAGDDKSLRRTLSRPHYPMRAITLSPGEISAVIAYIGSLQRPDPEPGR